MIDLLALRQALEAAWQPDTAHLKVREAGNPALGQCYPTARVVQHFFPQTEIVEGAIKTPSGNIEKHFWNLLYTDSTDVHIDFSWQQFPHGSAVLEWKIRDRETLGDSPQTLERVAKLLSRVQENLQISLHL